MRRLGLLLLVLATAGCGGPPRMTLLDARAERRTSGPAMEPVPYSVVGLHVRNEGPGTARSVRVRYDVLVAERWTGPTSMAPPGWKPRMSWVERACYLNRPIIAGAVAYLACDEDEFVHGVRVTSLQGGNRPLDTAERPGRPFAYTRTMGNREIEAYAWKPAHVVPSLDPDVLREHLVRLDREPASELYRYEPVPLEVALPGRCVAAEAPPSTGTASLAP